MMELISITVICPVTEKEVTINDPIHLMPVYGDKGEGIIFSFDNCPECGESHSDLIN